MSDRDLEMVKLREQRDDAIDRAVKAELKLTGIKALAVDGYHSCCGDCDWWHESIKAIING